jgi:hypothetical protein
MDDAQRRGHGGLRWVKEAEEACLDQPGMVMTDRGWETFEADGLRISFPTAEFEDFYDDLRHLPRREFENRVGYYKLHGWLHCIVMTVKMRDEAVQIMARLLPAVRERAKAEDAEWDRRIEEMNKSPHLAIGQKAMIEKGLIAPVSGKLTGDKN